jgi:hypothetical protein
MLLDKSQKKHERELIIKQVPQYSSLNRCKRKPRFNNSVSQRTYLDKIRQNLAWLPQEILQVLNDINSSEQMYAFLATNLYCLSTAQRLKLGCF